MNCMELLRSASVFAWPPGRSTMRMLPESKSLWEKTMGLQTESQAALV